MRIAQEVEEGRPRRRVADVAQHVPRADPDRRAPAAGPAAGRLHVAPAVDQPGQRLLILPPQHGQEGTGPGLQGPLLAAVERFHPSRSGPRSIQGAEKHLLHLHVLLRPAPGPLPDHEPAPARFSTACTRLSISRELKGLTM